jgi:hypothetical protein
MSDLVLPQQDFFLYVPALHDAEEMQLWPSNLQIARQEAAILPETLDNWVQIPIEGKLTVYARIWEVAE